MRIYLPLTMTGLARLHEQQMIVGSLTAHAVTHALREDWPEGDAEEHEYAALMAAAFDSLVLISVDGGPARRVVVAAEVDPFDVRDSDEQDVSMVVVDGDITIAMVEAIYVDETSAQPAVTAALVALPMAAAGEPDGLRAVSLVEHELLWFARQELGDLLA